MLGNVLDSGSEYNIMYAYSEKALLSSLEFVLM